jgi:hypothetical protein
LWLAGGFPTGRGNRAKHCVQIIDRERDMDRSNVARFEIDAFSVRWREVLEQFNLMSGSFEHGDRNLRTGHAGDFAGEITSLMRAMRKLEAKNILPEGERPLDVRDRETGVIGGNDAKRLITHEMLFNRGLRRFRRFKDDIKKQMGRDRTHPSILIRFIRVIRGYIIF